jgi:phycoerythrin-associated linker protein
VPYIRGWKTEATQTMVGFTHLFELVRGASSSSLKGNIVGKSPRLNALTINATPTAVVPPSGGSAGWSFRTPANSAKTLLGAGATDQGKVYRVEATAYRANAVNRVSKYRRSNQVYFVPYEQLSTIYQRIHKEGGVIASITPV